MKSKQITTILGIDTSCDDTSAAIIQGNIVLANVVASQIELHRKWGGVVPDIARDAHKENIDLVIKEAFKRASKNKKTINNQQSTIVNFTEIDAIAVTYGPGLAIALEVGIKKAKELAIEHNIPLIPVNHMEGHLLSSLGATLTGKTGASLTDKSFPLLGVLISGGHTELIYVKELGDYVIVGETLDDAMGEAYDKVARMLDLGYPGGPIITELAKKGDKDKIPLPIPMQRNDSLDFSYSGLKTAVYYKVKKIKEKRGNLTKKQILDLAASFEYSAIKHLTDRIKKAIKAYDIRYILVGGGVTSSPKVRSEIRKLVQKFGVEVAFPIKKEFYMDNGAMIAIAAFYKAQRRQYKAGEFLDIDREPRASIQG